ncbi:MAG: biotin--[acetyl-CoA-carboxylase] synthetase, partial [Pseudomonadota bacterium]
MASASPLNCVRIEQALSQQGLTCECHASLDSTNNALARERHRHRHLVLAEQQTAGRGRRGRRWIAPVPRA